MPIEKNAKRNIYTEEKRNCVVFWIFAFHKRGLLRTHPLVAGEVIWAAVRTKPKIPAQNLRICLNRHRIETWRAGGLAFVDQH